MSMREEANNLIDNEYTLLALFARTRRELIVRRAELFRKFPKHMHGTKSYLYKTPFESGPTSKFNKYVLSIIFEEKPAHTFNGAASEIADYITSRKYGAWAPFPSENPRSLLEGRLGVVFDYVWTFINRPCSHPR